MQSSFGYESSRGALCGVDKSTSADRGPIGRVGHGGAEGERHTTIAHGTQEIGTFQRVGKARSQRSERDLLSIPSTKKRQVEQPVNRHPQNNSIISGLLLLKFSFLLETRWGQKPKY